MRRILVRRVDEEVIEGVPPEGGQDPQAFEPPQGKRVSVDQGNEVPLVPPDMNNREIREATLTLARAMTTHVTRDIGPKVNALESTMTSSLRDFVMTNPPNFLGSKMGEYPKPSWMRCIR